MTMKFCKCKFHCREILLSLRRRPVMVCIENGFRIKSTKNLMPVTFPPAILGPEMAAPILWAPGIFGFFLLENPMPIKFLFFGGGGFERGMEAPILLLFRKAQSTRTAKFDPRTLSRKCSRKCPRECTRRCPRKCPRRLRLVLCKTHQRIPTKTHTRVLTGNFLVLTEIFQCSRKCTRK